MFQDVQYNITGCLCFSRADVKMCSTISQDICVSRCAVQYHRMFVFQDVQYNITGCLCFSRTDVKMCSTISQDVCVSARWTGKSEVPSAGGLQ